MDLATFGVDDLVAISDVLRSVQGAAATMEQAGQLVVEHFARSLRAGGEPAVALARLYVTQRAEVLDDELRAFATDAAGGQDLEPTTPCLTLVATTGLEPAWCDRHRSVGHRAVPLPSAAAIERSPMVARLFADLDVAAEDVLRPGLTTRHHRDHDVFFVPDARGDPSIPAQAEFVDPYGIRSVLGVGGFLPSGELFALVLFLRAPAEARVAEHFRTVAVSLKATLIPFTYRVFG